MVKTSNIVTGPRRNYAFIKNVSAIKPNVVSHAATNETRQPVVVNGSDNRRKQSPFLCVELSMQKQLFN